MIFGHDLYFWVAVIGAALVKHITSPAQKFMRSVGTTFAALFAAWVFTKPVLHFLNLPSDTYTIPVAVLAGLTGEGIMRWTIYFSNNPKEAIEFLKTWRTK